MRGRIFTKCGLSGFLKQVRKAPHTAPLNRGAVAERLRGRSFYFLLFCGVKREAENPFEIETHGSISPHDTHSPYRTALIDRCWYRKVMP
jgi:hypothetical protein